MQAPRSATARERAVELLSLFCPAIDPVEERLVPERAVLRFQNPVAFIGENQQLGRDLTHLERGVKLEALRVGDAEIQLAVDDQGGRLKLLNEMTGRPFVIYLGIVPRHAAELPHREPQLFG